MQLYRIGSQAITVEPVRTIAILAQRSKLQSSVAIRERYLYGARIYKQNSPSLFEWVNCNADINM
jgi:hypothetical protein